MPEQTTTQRRACSGTGSSPRRSQLVFGKNYLGKTDPTFTLNFSTGSAMILAQYYNLVRLGRAGYAYVIGMMQRNRYQSGTTPPFAGGDQGPDFVSRNHSRIVKRVPLPDS